MQRTDYDSYKILIVEDEVFIADFLESLLNSIGFRYIYKTYNKADAAVAIENLQPQIVLMDINLHSKLEGVELAKKLPDSCILIYITGQNDLEVMAEALATKPYSYLTKPIKQIDLMAAIEIAVRKKNKKYYLFKDGHAVIRISIEDILYVKSDNNYIDIVLLDKKYTARSSLKNFIEAVNSADFKQVHRSYIVNMPLVTKFTSNALFIHQVRIPISRNMFDNLSL